MMKRVMKERGHRVGIGPGICLLGSALVALPLEAAIDPATLVRVETFPPALHLTVAAPAERFVVSAIDSSGLRHDLTESAQFEPSPEVSLEENGLARGITPGSGELRGTVFGHPFSISVIVDAIKGPEPSPLSFVHDVLPILSRAGCNGGSCHAKPNGQNSFELSVFASDPKSDYREIVSDARGRRVFPGAPEASLLLQKPTLQIPHQGGKRLEPGSDPYEAIARWIREGMVYTLPDESELKSVEILPPQARLTPKSQHQVRVDAVYADGTRRDITQMAEFIVSDKELLSANDSGLLKTAAQSGQAVLLARYLGHVGQLRVTIPASGSTLPDVDFKAQNFIDHHAAEYFANLRLSPSGPCQDNEFLRRAYLDGVGRLPSPQEARAYLEDTRPDKRRHWINRILEDPLYGDYWANKWADLLRPNPDRVGVKSVFLLDHWLREEFRRNRPYDAFVRSIIEHRGSNHGIGPGVIFRDRRTPTQLSSMFSQLFLGVRMECARCHHHPFEKWSQSDFYQFAAFFGSVGQKGAGLSPPISAGTESFFFRPGGKVSHPVTEETMHPKAPDGPSPSEAGDGDPRSELMGWLLAPDNPYFARALVNRVWASFFGRGFVNPVDDFRDSNPPVNETLLDALATHFVETGYDLKNLMATIMNSSLYQRSSLPNSSNRSDLKSFSRYYRKRLPAETLLDAICDITKVPESFDGMPPGSRAIETWSYKIKSHFLDAFSRPNSSSDPPCERDDRSSVVQALHLMHSQTLQEKLAHPEGWVSQLARSDAAPHQIIEDIYLACFSRFPRSEELEIALGIFPEAPEASRQNAVEDLLWALINTAEFVFNH